MYGQEGDGSGMGGRGYGGNGGGGGGGGYGGYGGGHGGSGGGGGEGYGGGGYGGAGARGGGRGGRGGEGGGGYGGGNSRGGGSGGGGGYQGGDRHGGYQGGGQGGGGGNRGGGGGKEGDWLCPDPSCGNLNFAKRDKCYKCGALPPPGTGDRGDRGGGNYYRGGNDGGFGNSRGGRDGGSRGGGYGQGRDDGGYGQGRDDGYSQGRDGGGYGQGRDDGGYSQGPPVAPSYGGPGGNYPAPPGSYGGNPNYDNNAVPPPNYTSGPASYPPPYGATANYGSDMPANVRGGGGRGGYSGGYGGGPRNSGDGYVGAQADPPAKVKQCDENCGDTCDNSRIYISNLPPDVTIEELRELFGSIGQIARIKQKRGYKDQWPWSIKLYTDEQGNNKGDAVLSYEDPSAAHSAGGFFNGHELRGYKICVTMAEKSAPKPGPSYGSGGGGRGGYGGDRRRDNHRGGGGSGPDRNYHGGNRSRPY